MEKDDVLQDECAVFGCITKPECAENVHLPDIIYLGLTALQHRGQESTGMVINDGSAFHTKKGAGLVANVFADKEELHNVKGHVGIGHNRYATMGKSYNLSCQPFVVHTIHGELAIAHNGELVNATQIRKKILKGGTGLSTLSDTELLIQLLSREPPSGEPNGVDWTSRIAATMEIVNTSYSVVMMTSQEELYAFRDPYGNRPLCLGELEISYSVECEGGKMSQKEEMVYLVSSETCVFSSIGAKFIREVVPGEILRLSVDGYESMRTVPRPNNNPTAFCIFEYVYFARADSVFEGQLVHSVRKECGRRLAIEGPVEADLVSTIPDSATPAARSFAEQSGIPYDDVVVKNRYIGRTFIQPNSLLRKNGVNTKFGPLHENIKGKRIVIVDDSIVRGNTMPRIIELLRNAGAKEIHIRIASPPLKHPCFMGINIPTSDELIANKYESTELAKFLGVESLVYLSVEGLRQSVSKDSQNKTGSYCMACLTGEYPIELEW